MDTKPFETRDQDPMEAALNFLFKNWLLLISLPLIAGIVAFIVLQSVPRTYTASARIPAPPAFVAASGDFWRTSPGRDGISIAGDGSVLLINSAATAADARSPVDATQADVKLLAAQALAKATERHAKLADLSERLLTLTPPSDQNDLPDQAMALAAVLQAYDSAAERLALLDQWTYRLQQNGVIVSDSNGSERIIPFTVFAAFTLALAIAIVIRFLKRGTKG